MIGIGAYFRGPELKDSSVDRRLSEAMKAVRMMRGDWKEGDAPAVIVLFVVPGSLGDVNFSGQRVTLFSRKKKLLQIEAAVPKDLVSATRIDDFVIDALRQASRTAAEHFSKKKAGVFDLAKAEEIVEKVRQSLVAAGY